MVLSKLYTGLMVGVQSVGASSGRECDIRGKTASPIQMLGIVASTLVRGGWSGYSQEVLHLVQSASFGRTLHAPSR